jgi:AP-3 complex subunit mu
MAQTVFILDSFGSIIIEKHFRGIINRNVVDTFWEEVEKKAPYFAEVPPVITTTKYYLIHIRKSDLFMLAVLTREQQPLLVLTFLHRVADIFTQYFGDFNEARLKDNFVTAYQLIDEMNDGGLPFNLEPNILEDMIAPPNILTQAHNLVMGPGNSVSSILPSGSLSQVPWRRQGVKKATNEIYIDINEEIDGIIEANGSPSGLKIVGKVVVDCQLSGMPDILLRFGYATQLEDIGFHPCVRLKRWDQEKVISFVPPDGVFTLMTYVSKTNVQLPIFVRPQIIIGENNGTVNIGVGSKNITGDREITNLIVTVPFSKSCGGTSLSSKTGMVHFDENTKVCKWRIPTLQTRGLSPVLEGNFQFDPEQGKPSLPIIGVDFLVNTWAASGLKVDTMTLVNEKYNHFKGFKGSTKGGDLHFRLC